MLFNTTYGNLLHVCIAASTLITSQTSCVEGQMGSLKRAFGESWFGDPCGCGVMGLDLEVLFVLLF